MTTSTELQARLASETLAERIDAIRELAGMEEAANWAAVTLLECCASDHQELREWAVAALEQLGRPPQESFEEICRLTASSDELVAYWACTLLGRLERDAQPALECLTSLVTCASSSAVQRRAAWAVKRIQAS
jgi:hypothetical protein